ncbi:BNR-4 repeat-containing protein [Mariniflexile sp.]|uniref:BNR-4 repeat-containing protein n=1 Tax=Mariniflexile sp. TaxID=1979402 RepID=UPI004047D856
MKIKNVFFIFSLVSYSALFAQKDLQLLDKAELLSRYELTKTAYCSDGSDRAQNGSPRFNGPMEAKITSFLNYQYIAYYEGNGDIVIARKKTEPHSKWEKSILQGYKIKSEDRHNKIALDISKGDGVIHLSFDHHNTPHFNYAHSNQNVASNPDSVVWDNSIFKLLPNLGMKDDTGMVTYPTFYQLNATGGLIIYWRTGGALGGEMNLANYNSADHTWHFIGRISTQEGAYLGKNESRGPYTSKFADDADGNLHVSWVFRERAFADEEGKKGNFAEHGLYYAQSSDGGFTWKNNWGEVIADVKNNLVMGIDNMKDLPVEIPMNLNPVHTGLTSIMDLKTNNFITFLNQYKPGTTKKINYIHIRDSKGVWTTKETNLSHQGKIEIQGDRMFVFSGSGISVSNRSSNFTDWNTISFPVQFANGSTNWDTEQLDKGIISMVIQYDPKKLGEPSPVEIFDFKIFK